MALVDEYMCDYLNAAIDAKLQFISNGQAPTQNQAQDYAFYTLVRIVCGNLSVRDGQAFEPVFEDLRASILAHASFPASLTLNDEMVRNAMNMLGQRFDIENVPLLVPLFEVAYPKDAGTGGIFRKAKCYIATSRAAKQGRVVPLKRARNLMVTGDESVDPPV